MQRHLQHTVIPRICTWTLDTYLAQRRGRARNLRSACWKEGAFPSTLIPFKLKVKKVLSGNGNRFFPVLINQQSEQEEMGGSSREVLTLWPKARLLIFKICK